MTLTPHEIYCMSGQGTNQLLENGAMLYLRPKKHRDAKDHGVFLCIVIAQKELL